MKVKYLVIGAGITGLSFAKSMLNDDVLVLEKNNYPGGMAATYEMETAVGSFKFDIGGHWFHNKDLGEKLEEIADLRKIEMDWHERKAFVQLNAENFVESKDTISLIDFPLQNNYMKSKELDIERIRKELEDLKESDFSNYEKMLQTSYGETLYKVFFNSYNKKLFGRPLNEINVHPFMKVRNVQTGNKGYNDKFMYPSGGRGIVSLVKEIGSGVRVLYDHKVSAINTEEKYCIVKDKKIYYEFLISTLPLKELAEIADIESCKASAEKLEHSKGNIWLMGIKKKEYHNKINWVYNSSEELSYYRWGTFTRVDEKMAPEGYSSIYIEANTEYGIKKNYEGILKDLKNNGIIGEVTDVICAKNICLPYNYCFYSKEVDEIKAVFEEKNIYSIGRYGSWHWSSMNQDIKQALELTDIMRRNYGKNSCINSNL